MYGGHHAAHLSSFSLAPCGSAPDRGSGLRRPGTDRDPCRFRSFPSCRNRSLHRLCPRRSGLFDRSPQRVYGAYVTFGPGARTDWHTHPLGQTLIVTFGTGLTQEWGGPIRTIHQGDVIICRLNVKHWHGAAPGSAMTHLAIGEREDGKSVTWMEKVTAGQYPEK